MKVTGLDTFNELMF